MHRRSFIKTACKLGTLTLCAPQLLSTLASSDVKKASQLQASMQNKFKEQFEALMMQAIRQKWYLMPIADIFTRVGMYFIDLPYIANTLEYQPESVIVDFSGFDCFTFVEVALNIARVLKNTQFDNITPGHSRGDKDMLLLKDSIQYTRYRGGVLAGYESRLHYASDWIFDNIKKGVIKDITKECVAVEHKLNVWYMSKNYKQYPALANASKSLLNKIKNVEKELNNKYCYIIPTGECADDSVTNILQDGDIIAIATSTPGLDYGHLGIMFNGRLLHASSKKKQVILDSTICDYLKSSKGAFGISILRLL